MERKTDEIVRKALLEEFVKMDLVSINELIEKLAGTNITQSNIQKTLDYMEKNNEIKSKKMGEIMCYSSKADAQF